MTERSFVGTGIRHHSRGHDAPLHAAFDHQENVGRLPADGPAVGAVTDPHAPAQTPGVVCNPMVTPLLLLAVFHRPPFTRPGDHGSDGYRQKDPKTAYRIIIVRWEA